ncbi:transketolase [Salibacter halophilus]|uniref:Transketolase n=1 Tax=Salibacter halophilus TaxID=1803916 RepID=A0A6N6M4M2_9FLAO|nr:transketolase [Salibacter halophilus]KAB1064429.1 transketolase [Salibacter halophilus]
MADSKELKQIASQVRRDIVRMVHSAQSGHPGGSLGCADLFVALYFDILKNDPKNFTLDGKDENLFFLSNGHISPVWYSTLARKGFFELSELKTFRQLDSRLQGHPATEEGLPGIRVASGSLGQGLSVAAGAALTKKLNGEDKLVYVLMGDGEQQEGQVWEAAMFAAHKKIDNIIGFIDWNNRQIDGDVTDVLDLKDLRAKYESFGWEVLEMDGNNMDMILDTIGEAQKMTGRGKPIMILMKTEMGQGVDFMMGTHKWHGVAPNNEQLEQALQQLDETLGDY